MRARLVLACVLIIGAAACGAGEGSEMRPDVVVDVLARPDIRVDVGNLPDVSQDTLLDVAVSLSDIAPDAAADVSGLVEEELAAFVAPYLSREGSSDKACALVVGISSPHVRFVAGYGATVCGGTDTPTGSDIFEVGSVSKVFTGYLLARALLAEEVDLEDEIGAWFPGGAPSFEGQGISLLDLATHTSGLPRWPGNLYAPGTTNPAAGYGPEALAEYLAGHDLDAAPGSSFQYSNVGAGTLGYVLTLAGGAESWEALAAERVTEPMALVDTVVTLSSEQEQRRVQGYAGLTTAPAVSIGEAMVGAGALRSTGEELLSFVERALAGEDEAWALVTTPRRPSPFGTDAETGFLLNIEEPESRGLHSKNGTTPGFFTQVMFTLDPSVAVVLLANNSRTEGLYDLAQELLKLVAERTTQRSR